MDKVSGKVFEIFGDLHTPVINEKGYVEDHLLFSPVDSFSLRGIDLHRENCFRFGSITFSGFIINADFEVNDLNIYNLTIQLTERVSTKEMIKKTTKYDVDGVCFDRAVDAKEYIMRREIFKIVRDTVDPGCDEYTDYMISRISDNFESIARQVEEKRKEIFPKKIKKKKPIFLHAEG